MDNGREPGNDQGSFRDCILIKSNDQETWYLCYAFVVTNTLVIIDERQRDRLIVYQGDARDMTSWTYLGYSIDQPAVWHLDFKIIMKKILE